MSASTPQPASVDEGTVTQHRCERCGQFTGFSGHNCPILGVPHHRYRDGNTVIVMPEVGQLVTEVDLTDEVLIPVREAHILDGAAYHVLHGDVTINPPLDDYSSSRLLDCSCGEVPCGHRQTIAEAVRSRIADRMHLGSQRRAAITAMTALAEEHERSEMARQHRLDTVPVAGSRSYLDDPEAFQTAYDAARARRASGEQAVPMLYDDATGGLGVRDGGRAFGIELEFDLSRQPRDRLQAIATDLYAAGLSRDTSMVRWHASARDGYTEARDGWRLERDATVSGEVVSPILYDTPETWRDLETVCEIVRRHGGTASMRAGGHVHVAAGNFDHEVGHHNRLLRIADAHSDVLFRLASNPDRGRHRGQSYCNPRTVPAQGYRAIGDARAVHNHYQAVNLQSMHGAASDHVEYRLWDASLNPAVIQTQVKLSLGITDAAFRGATPHGTSLQIGHHHDHYGGRGPGARLRGQEWKDSTRGFRELMDTVFHRDVDKAQATSLFAVTRWQRPE